MRSIADAQGIAIAGGIASYVVDSMAHNGTKEQALHIRALEGWQNATHTIGSRKQLGNTCGR